MIGAGQKELDQFGRRWQSEKERLAAVEEKLLTLAESIAAEA